MTEFNAPSNPWSLILTLSPQKLKCTSHTLLVNIRKNDSRRSNAQLPRDSPINSWLVCIDKMVKSKSLSESSDKVLRLSTSLPDKTHSRFSLKLLFKEEPEKIQPESVPEVPSEDKPSMSLHWEESIKLSTSCARDPEMPASDLTRPWARPSATKSSLPQRVSANPTRTLLRRRTRSRELPRVTDERTRFVYLLLYWVMPLSNGQRIYFTRNCFICRP